MAKLNIWKTGLSITLIMLTLMAPSEKTLGSVIKLVYLHGAMSWVISLLLIITGVIAAGSLANKNWYATARASLKVSLGFQLVNMAMVPVVTGLTWGVLFAWQEPRVILTVFLLGLTLAIYLIEDSFAYTKVGSLLLSLPGVVRLITLGRIGRLMHPSNPVGSSDSIAIKGFSLGILLVALALSLVWLVDMSRREKREKT
jgi:hypothetical protein